MVDMYRVLICDDQPDIVNALKIYLKPEGYELLEAYTGLEALETVKTQPVDLVLMDIMMPGMDGMQATSLMREISNIPVILLTAKSEDTDKIMGLNIGADDYMSKPLSMREVKARVKAVLRRSNKLKNTVEEVEDFDDECIDFESLKINLVTKRVYVDNKEVQFTRLEFELLALLVQNAGKVFSREMILDKIWPGDAVVMDRTVDVNITRIRKKIGDYGKYIKTRFGYGYTFDS